MPLEVWYGHSAIDFDRLYVFGCPVYFHVMEIKLDPRVKKAVLLGFNTGVNGYGLWCLKSTFDQSCMLKNQHEITQGDSNHMNA